jgi:diguanylate cyclase (GGDEF)-like protein
VVSLDLVAVTGVLALGAIGYATLRWRRQAGVLGGQAVALAGGVAVLAASGAGVAGGARAWFAIVAYPLLGRAFVGMVARYRRIREADAVVEGALVGAALGILLHVRTGGEALGPVLVGLDVAVLVVASRALRSPSARAGAFAPFVASVVLLTGAHVVLALGQATTSTTAFTLAAASLAGIGFGAAHPRVAAEPEPLAEELPTFSRTHAAVVVAALLVAPGVLALQAVIDITTPATIATGSVISGTVLAGYLVVLLQERAATEHRATHDGLTELPNRALFADRLDRVIARARRTGKPAAVLFVDLDGFKDVNDTFGHAAGDVLLRTVADRLRTCRRADDTVARLAGDEFAVLLPDAGGEDVIGIAQRVLDSLDEPVTLAEERVRIVASVGVAVFPDDGFTADELLASADAAMYRAKEGGGGRYEVFNVALATHAHARLRLESALYDGMARGELVLHYQPIVELATGITVGAEALVRWEHPEQGLLLPGHFVPVAERSDLVVRLGERVIADACAELRRWEDLGLGGRTIAVNVSSRHFAHGLANSIASTLRATGADPNCLVIELTEGTAVDNLDAVAATLEDLRDIGVRCAIDDFGTGYCGLRYLGTLPVDALKIDRSFVQGMTPSSAAIVAATIAMGHSLGMTLIAEGVETIEQLRFLESQGCDRVQGFLVGRPGPAQDLVDRLREERVEFTLREAMIAEAPPAVVTPILPRLQEGAKARVGTS